jgi:bacillithiol biosynthesis cysteine-adding enzyme BshC
MMPSADFSSIPGFSKLYLDFFKKNSPAWQRFPANHDVERTFSTRLESFKNRAAMQQIFDVTMASLDVSEVQRRNLELLKNDNSLIVITGQQVGFFGGAEYTFFKAQSAIAHAQQFGERCPDKIFIPVFWVEDNDHDRAEAEVANILSDNAEILSLKAPGDLPHQPNATIGAIRLTDEISGFLNNLSEQLPASPFTEDISRLLKDIYTPGKLWSDAYMELLHHFFKNTGLLFVKGSEVRKSGLPKEILLKEIATAGGSKAAAGKAGGELLKAGYHVQAEPSDVHLFLHEGEQRFKINKSDDGSFTAKGRNYSREELLKIAENSPQNFSPNVLLRPIVQDLVFPTAAYIAGPGELAYAAELREMYEFFDVEMPVWAPRHSATLVDFKTEKFLAKQNLEISEFFKSWQEVERDFTQKISDPEINALFKENNDVLLGFLKNIEERAVAIDKTLAGAVAATETVTAKQFTKLLKKINAAQKRREAELFKKYRQTWTRVFPGALQERFFSIVHYLAEFGEESVRAALQNFNESRADAHFVISLKNSVLVEKAE